MQKKEILFFGSLPPLMHQILHHLIQHITLHQFFMPVVCVLHDIPDNSKFPVWNGFQFCLTARQADRLKQLPYSRVRMCTRDKMPYNSLTSEAKYYETASLRSDSCSKYNIQLKLSCSSIIHWCLETDTQTDKVNQLLYPAFHFTHGGNE